MINRELINPQSIVVVGGSNNVHKPGGRIVRNLLDGKYKGELCVVNAKETDVQGVKSYPSVHDIPETELAIISIPSKSCPEVMEVLARQKGVKAFIVISAGFGEETHEGGILEQQMLDVVNEAGASLIGPNCIGLMNMNYHGVFTHRYRNSIPMAWISSLAPAYGLVHYRVGADKRAAFLFCLVGWELQAEWSRGYP